MTSETSRRQFIKNTGGGASILLGLNAGVFTFDSLTKPASAKIFLPPTNATSRRFTVPGTDQVLRLHSYTSDKVGVEARHAAITDDTLHGLTEFFISDSLAKSDDINQLTKFINQVTTHEVGDVVYANSLFDDGGDHAFHANRIVNGRPEVSDTVEFSNQSYSLDSQNWLEYGGIQISKYSTSAGKRLMVLDLYTSGEWRRYQISDSWADYGTLTSDVNSAASAWEALFITAIAAGVLVGIAGKCVLSILTGRADEILVIAEEASFAAEARELLFAAGGAGVVLAIATAILGATLGIEYAVYYFTVADLKSDLEGRPYEVVS